MSIRCQQVMRNGDPGDLDLGRAFGPLRLDRGEERLRLRIKRSNGWWLLSLPSRQPDQSNQHLNGNERRTLASPANRGVKDLAAHRHITHHTGIALSAP